MKYVTTAGGQYESGCTSVTDLSALLGITGLKPHEEFCIEYLEEKYGDSWQLDLSIDQLHEESGFICMHLSSPSLLPFLCTSECA